MTNEVIIKGITIEGFGSIIEPIEYQWDSPGVNLILGQNGSGKTTLINALSWALYNSVLKEGSSITPWPSIIKKSKGIYKGTKVAVDFSRGDKNYSVVRCKDYTGKVAGQHGGNKVFFLIDGKSTKNKYKRDIAKDIQEAIGYSFNLFKNAIVFGQEMERLMKESGPNKRKVLEEAFDVSFIDRAREVVEKRLKKLEDTQSDILNSLEVSKDKLETFDENTQKIIREQKRMVEYLEGKIENLNKGLSKDKISPIIKEKRRDLKKLLKSYTKPTKEAENKIDLFKLEFALLGKKGELESLQAELKSLKSSTNDFTCDKCGQKLPESKRKKITQERFDRMVSIRDKIKSLGDKIQSNERDIEKAKEEEKREKRRGKEATAGLSISILQKSIQDLIRKKTLNDSIRNELKETNLKLQGAQKIISQTQHERELEQKVLVEKVENLRGQVQSYQRKIERDKWLIKQPLSNTGIKSYIIDTMIESINDCLERYYSKVGFEIAMSVDLNSARKDINVNISKFGNIVSYSDLSKGQKQLVDIVLMFSIHDTVIRNKPLNISIMDEVFESISSDNVQTVSDIILEKSITTNIHIVTHQLAFNPLNAKKTHFKLNSRGITTVEK